MTTPTQAQIEAAAEAIEEFGFLAINSADAYQAATAALTAAAEMAEPKSTDFLGMAQIIKEQTAELERLREIIWDLSGNIAAEGGSYVGMQVDKSGLVLKYTDKDLDETEAATIERCAQWLKERDRSPHVHFLADKMCSALKDKP